MMSWGCFTQQWLQGRWYRFFSKHFICFARIPGASTMTFHLFLGSEIQEKREKHLHLLIQQASWDLYFFAGITRKKKKWVPLESHYRLEVLPQNLNEITKIRCVWRDPNNRRFQRGILLNQAIISQGFLLIFDRCIPFPWCWFFLQNTKLPHVMGHTKPADLQFFNSVVSSWQTKTTLR